MKTDSEKGKYTNPDGSATWEYIGVMSCASLLFCTGCVAGWSSPSLGILMQPDLPIPLSDRDASTLTAMPTLGHALAPVLTIGMVDKLGRKNSLLMAGIPAIMSWALMVVSDKVVVLFAARFIGGLSFGLIICITPIYLGEIASTKLRGAIGTVCSIMANAGMLFMFTVAPHLSVPTMACACLSIATLSTMSACFVPESPYFLAMVGRTGDAEATLEKLRGKTDVAEELELIGMTVGRRGGQKRSAWKQLFCVSGNRKALGIIFLFISVLQLGSYVSIVVYGDIIFTKMNAGVDSDVCSLLVAVIQLVCNILVVFVIDKLGRKPLICGSGIVSGLCVLIVGVYFYLMEYTNVDVTSYGLLALCATFVNIFAINVGYMPLSMVVQSEILGTEVKALATCFIGIGGGIISTIGAKCYLMVAETWGYGHSVPFLGFAATTWFCTSMILKLLPETKGKTLFDIQRDLNA